MNVRKMLKMQGWNISPIEQAMGFANIQKGLPISAIDNVCKIGK